MFLLPCPFLLPLDLSYQMKTPEFGKPKNLLGMMEPEQGETEPHERMVLSSLPLSLMYALSSTALRRHPMPLRPSGCAHRC